MSDDNAREYDLDATEEGMRAVTIEADGTMHDTEAFLETFDPEKDKFGIAERSKWRNAKANLKLRDQINAKFPDRKKASDGTIGDTKHCPGSSDHCPNIVLNGVGVVTAIDITHDPDSGCDIHKIADTLLASKDPRIKYIISNSRIGSSYPKGNIAAWTWRKYSGSNPHTAHAHISVQDEASRFDDDSDWVIG